MSDGVHQLRRSGMNFRQVWNFFFWENGKNRLTFLRKFSQKFEAECLIAAADMTFVFDAPTSSIYLPHNFRLKIVFIFRTAAEAVRRLA